MPLFPPPTALVLLASTPAGGFALQNGTPVILSWTAPNDGKQHRIVFFSSKHVSVNETGGIVDTFGGTPTPANAFNQLLSGSLTVGDYMGNYNGMIVGPGQLVEVTQTALTVGTSVVWVEIWGS